MTKGAFRLLLAVLGSLSISLPACASGVVIFDGDSLVAGYPRNYTTTGPNTTFPKGTDSVVFDRKLGGG